MNHSGDFLKHSVIPQSNVEIATWGNNNVKKKEFEAAVERMADSSGLRRVPDKRRVGNTWMGICSGVSVIMNLDAVRLCVDFCSPEQSSDQDDQEEGDDADSSELDDDQPAFLRAAAKGIPESWFLQYEGEVWGFQLFIDQKLRKTIDPESFDGLIDSIAKDLNDLGAEESQPCSECGQDATTLGMFDSFSQGSEIIPFCNSCWEQIQEQTRGTIKVGEPTHMRSGWTFLFFSTIVFSMLWGGAQHPALGIPWGFLFIGCAAIGVAISVGTSWIAQGSNLGLRLGVAFNVTLATFAGNMIGIKLLNGPLIPWENLVQIYFLSYFPAHLGQELTFLASGIVGVIIGFFVLRESERVRVR